ncbi:ROK family transcriptional regulator [Rhizobium sp. P28RR-XV]|uniref:ROK family transcriptional regulator n=1 Tax=Rhizobium sp. P28RR-XV TaxID=2726737 RepID=UPI0014573FCB|nr:ROK family transcriptional regulator [Rhizobium sp. P28RR-XV]NLR88392.1 ROK family transcriptional regulator [Rhizobium sp. P28RR-XV]
MRIKGDQSTTRLINRRLVLDCLRRAGQLTRMELVGRTSLSPAAMSGVVGELIEEGFVVEGEAGESSGGRKPVPVSINYGFRVSIGIKLMHDRIDATMTDLSTSPIGFSTVEIDDTSIEVVTRAMSTAISELIPDPFLRGEKLLGIGVAMPGIIDVQRGVCIASPRLGWRDVEVARHLAVAADKPVWVDNDVNAYAIAQNLFGVSRHYRSSLALILGTGVGAAIMVNGQIWRGGRFSAGEIGINRIDGTRTWDEIFSLPAMQADWKAFCAQTNRPGNTLEEAVNLLDTDAIALLEQRGNLIAPRVAEMINLLDPEIVVLGGEVMQLGSALPDALKSALIRFVPGKMPDIVIDQTNDIWSRGAAALAIQSFFDFESVSGTQAASPRTLAWA